MCRAPNFFIALSEEFKHYSISYLLILLYKVVDTNFILYNNFHCFLYSMQCNFDDYQEKYFVFLCYCNSVKQNQYIF
jgi:hypothetical protein